MNRYRINGKITRANGTHGFRSITICAENILSAIEQLYVMALEQHIEFRIYSIFYLAEGIEDIV